MAWGNADHSEAAIAWQTPRIAPRPGGEPGRTRANDIMPGVVCTSCYEVEVALVSAKLDGKGQRQFGRYTTNS